MSDEPYILNLDRLMVKLGKLSECARGQVLKDAMEAGGRVVEGHAKINIEKNFSDHSAGALAGSIVVETEGDDKSAEASIGPTVVYGRIQELGGTIKPVNAKELVWTDPDTGVVMRAKRVVLPARPYLRPALDEHHGEIKQAVEAVLINAIEEAASGG